MKLASYNIRKAVGRDRRRDPGRIIDVVNSLSADVVVLQEADLRLGARPTALPRQMILDHTDFIPAPLADNDVSIGWHGNAVLVRRGLAVTDTRRLALPGLEPRGAVSVEIEGRFRIAGVHLGLLRRYRHIQMRELRGHLGGTALPTAILGDFNEWSRVAGMEEFQYDFHLHLPGPSFPTFRPTAHLDRIALSHDVGMTASGVHDTRLARIASDHLPVWAKVSLPQDAPHAPCAADG